MISRKGQTQNKWTSEQLDILSNRYEDTAIDIHEIADRVRHPWRSVIVKASKLGLHRSQRKFTDDQIEYVKCHYSDTPMEDMVKSLGLTSKQIRYIGNLLNIKRSKEIYSYELTKGITLRHLNDPNRLDDVAFKYKKLIRSNKDRYEVEITEEDYCKLITNSVCYYCGDPIDISRSNGKYAIDRLDNNLGYIKNNCVPCCSECNLVKGNRYTEEEFKIIVKAIMVVREMRKNKSN